MEHARTESDNHHEQEPYSGTEGSTDCRVEPCFTRRAEGSQNESNYVERRDFVTKDQRTGFSHDCMKRDIQPASDRIDRRIFPCLESVSIVDVMRWFPEIEHLVAILNRSKKGRNGIRNETDVKRYIQWQVERCWSGAALLC